MGMAETNRAILDLIAKWRDRARMNYKGEAHFRVQGNGPASVQMQIAGNICWTHANELAVAVGEPQMEIEE
jgi:hypothetical protein